MAKGIIYVMTTVVPGLIKIGKTGLGSLSSRMYQLEHNGYFNVAGLRRKFAIEVDDYDEKEQLLHDIFEKSRVPNSELFALDADLVIQLLSSFEGQQVYPETVSKKETFSEALEQRNDKLDRLLIPNGEYYLAQTVRGFGEVSAVMRVEEGVFTVLKGCACAPTKAEHVPEVRQNAPIENNTLLWDVSVDSPSAAGWIVLGYQNNGWMVWKNKDGHPIDIYRKK